MTGTGDTQAAQARRQPTAQDLRKIKSALLRFRVIAWVTGLWLLFLVGEMIYKYAILDDSSTAPDWFFYVAQIHGLFYMLYLVFTVDLAIKVRWTPGRIFITALAGTIPFLSFVYEHIRTREVKAAYDLD